MVFAQFLGEYLVGGRCDLLERQGAESQANGMLGTPLKELDGLFHHAECATPVDIQIKYEPRGAHALHPVYVESDAHMSEGVADDHRIEGVRAHEVEVVLVKQLQQVAEKHLALHEATDREVIGATGNTSPYGQVDIEHAASLECCTVAIWDADQLYRIHTRDFGVERLECRAAR